VCDEILEVCEGVRGALRLVGAQLVDEEHELDNAVRVDGPVDAVRTPKGNDVFDNLMSSQSALVAT